MAGIILSFLLKLCWLFTCTSCFLVVAATWVGMLCFVECFLSSSSLVWLINSIPKKTFFSTIPPFSICSCSWGKFGVVIRHAFHLITRSEIDVNTATNIYVCFFPENVSQILVGPKNSNILLSAVLLSNCLTRKSNYPKKTSFKEFPLP